MEVFCLKGPETISKINEVQLGMIATASLGSSVEVKQVKKVDLFFPHQNGTVRYRTTSVHKEQNGTIYNISISASLSSVPPNFWTCGGTVRLIFFRTLVNGTRSPYHFLERNGRVLLTCEQSLRCYIWIFYKLK